MKQADSKLGSGMAGSRNGEESVLRFLRTTLGSSCELEYRLLLAYDLGLLDYREYKQIESLLFDKKRTVMRSRSQLC